MPSIANPYSPLVEVNQIFAPPEAPKYPDEVLVALRSAGLVAPLESWYKCHYQSH